MKRICILTLGGTIAYSYKNGVPQIGDLSGFIESLHEVRNFAEVEVFAFRQKSSSAMAVSDLTGLAAEIHRRLQAGADGIVVVQGTDTIEETAFALELLHRGEQPVVITGAMRNPDMRGADGPANLLDAIRTAASDSCRGLGVTVVFNGAIYPAAYVRKIHPQSTEAFSSECGPLGYLAEGTVSLRVRPIRRELPWLTVAWNYKMQLNSAQSTTHSVPIYSVPIGEDGRLLKKVKECGCDGLILEAMGGGHVPTELVETLKELCLAMPVVLASRIGCGDMLTGTYAGYPGSETSLLQKGLISAGLLDGRKARILLLMLLGTGCNREQIGESFRIYSKAF